MHTKRKLSTYTADPQVIPRTSLLELLLPSSEHAGVSSLTMQQLFMMLRDYIKRRQLFDADNPSVVHCGHDTLGQLFGVDSFSIHNVLQLILDNVDIVETSDNDSCSPAKLSATTSASCDELNSADALFTAASLESSSSVAASSMLPKSAAVSEHELDKDELSDVETIYSVQSKVTEFVKDSTDDFWFLGSATDDDSEVDGNDVFWNELDLASEADNAVVSESDKDSILPGEDVIIICESESDLEFFADCEDSDSDDDEDDCELTDADKWVCRICETENKPIVRYCDYCWNLRPDWLPSVSVGLTQPAQCDRRDLTVDVSLSQQSANSNLEVCATPDSGIMIHLGSNTTAEPLCTGREEDGYGHNEQCVPMPRNHCKKRQRKRDLSDRTKIPSAPPKTEPNEGYWMCNSVDTKSNEILTLADAAFNIEKYGIAADCRASKIMTEDLESNVDGNNSVGLDVPTSSRAMQSADCSKEELIGSSPSPLRFPVSSMCIICLAAPKNASIVHGTTGHQSCCVTCARHLKLSGKPCPVCRRPIHKVVRNYIV